MVMGRTRAPRVETPLDACLPAMDTEMSAARHGNSVGLR